ncbi:hypothetical protein [Pseudomonas putida]|nr:hypothetical protein [Pseudomonas putida]
MEKKGEKGTDLFGEKGTEKEKGTDLFERKRGQIYLSKEENRGKGDRFI